MLKINIMVTLGDSHFLLSTIVEPNTAGTGVPTTTTSGGGSGGTIPVLTNTSGSYPWSIVNLAENYDLPY